MTVVFLKSEGRSKITCCLGARVFAPEFFKARKSPKSTLSRISNQTLTGQSDQNVDSDAELQRELQKFVRFSADYEKFGEVSFRLSEISCSKQVVQVGCKILLFSLLFLSTYSLLMCSFFVL